MARQCTSACTVVPIREAKQGVACLGEQARRGRTVGVRVTEAEAEELREREQGKIRCPMREINNDRPLVGAWVVDGRDEAQM